MFSAEDFEKRTEWPFKNMSIDEVVSMEIDATGRAKQGQIYVHVFGSQSGRKFKTQKMKKDGKEYIVFMRTK